MSTFNQGLIHLNSLNEPPNSHIFCDKTCKILPVSSKLAEKCSNAAFGKNCKNELWFVLWQVWLLEDTFSVLFLGEKTTKVEEAR